MPRACEKARRCVSSGRVAALGNKKLVTPYINVEVDGGGKSSLMLDNGNSSGFVVPKALYLLHLKHLPLKRPTSRLVETAGASPPVVLDEVEFEETRLPVLRAQVVAYMYVTGKYPPKGVVRTQIASQLAEQLIYLFIY